jgi:hypothetical protein
MNLSIMVSADPPDRQMLVSAAGIRKLKTRFFLRAFSV